MVRTSNLMPVLPIAALPHLLAHRLEQADDHAAVLDRLVAEDPRYEVIYEQLVAWSLVIDHPDLEVAAELATAPHHVRRLLTLPQRRDRHRLIETDDHLRSWGVAILLRNGVEGLSYSEGCQLAIHVAERLEPELYGEEELARLQRDLGNHSSATAPPLNSTTKAPHDLNLTIKAG